jgi:hypothetical protein
MQLIKPKSIFTNTGVAVESKKKEKKKVVTKPKKPKLTRQDKALLLVDSVGKKDDTTYLVQSQSDVNKVYEVVFLYGRKFGCQCHDFLLNDVLECKHILAVKLFMEREKKEQQGQQQEQKKDELFARVVKEDAELELDSGDSSWYTGPEPTIVEEEAEQ